MAGPVQRTSALQWRTETEQMLLSFAMQTFFWGVWFLRIGTDLYAVSVWWAAVGHMAWLVGEAGLIGLFQNSPRVIDIDLQWTACLNIIPNHTSCTLWWICCALFYRQRDMKCIFLTVCLSQPLHIYISLFTTCTIVRCHKECIEQKKCKIIHQLFNKVMGTNLTRAIHFLTCFAHCMLGWDL